MDREEKPLYDDLVPGNIVTFDAKIIVPILIVSSVPGEAKSTRHITWVDRNGVHASAHFSVFSTRPPLATCERRGAR